MILGTKCYSTNPYESYEPVTDWCRFYSLYYLNVFKKLRHWLVLNLCAFV